jgi:hypothetical protein
VQRVEARSLSCIQRDRYFITTSREGIAMTAEKSPQASVNEMFGQAAEFFQNAVQAGIRIQEQGTKSMSQLMSGLSSPQQWQESAQATMTQLMETTEKNMAEAIELMNRNTKSTMELLEKAFKAREAMGQGDGQARMREMWETAVGSFLRNSEVMLQANNRLLESWQKMASALQGEASSSSAGE